MFPRPQRDRPNAPSPLLIITELRAGGWPVSGKLRKASFLGSFFLVAGSHRRYSLQHHNNQAINAVLTASSIHPEGVVVAAALPTAF
jgi:hypothetical protein